MTWITRNATTAALLAVACGDGGGSVDPGDGQPEPQSGVVVVANRTPFEVEVAYLRRGSDGEAEVVRSTVGAGERADVGGGMLAAGTEMELDLVLLVPAGQGLRVRRKATIMVDGDVEVVLDLSAADDPFAVEVSVRRDRS